MSPRFLTATPHFLLNSSELLCLRTFLFRVMEPRSQCIPCGSNHSVSACCDWQVCWWLTWPGGREHTWGLCSTALSTTGLLRGNTTFPLLLCLLRKTTAALVTSMKTKTFQYYMIYHSVALVFTLTVKPKHRLWDLLQKGCCIWAVTVFVLHVKVIL